MAKPGDIWMPFYVGDYLADTSHLDTLEHGAYLLLICHYWRTQAPLPDDDGQLRRIVRMGPKAWIKHRDVLARLFQVGGGVWKHRRIDTEIGNSTSRSRKAHDKAKLRWDNETGRATAQPQECSSPSQSQEERNNHKNDCSETAPETDLLGDAAPTRMPLAEIRDVVEAWNAMAGPAGLSAVQKLTTARRSAILARLRDCGANPLDGIKIAFGKVAASRFLRGENGGGSHGNWRADFDFVMREQSFTKLMEGKYDDRNGPGGRSGPQSSGRSASHGGGFAQLRADALAAYGENGPGDDPDALSPAPA